MLDPNYGPTMRGHLSLSVLKSSSNFIRSCHSRDAQLCGRNFLISFTSSSRLRAVIAQSV
jgi:hypothetical protein